jgi:CDP-2,3-bis-(O-geranylgeranyl)-sn-glycerol synthase
MAAGLLAAALEAHLLRGTSYDLWAGRPEWYVGMGLALSAGALLGDLAGSFIKRRLGLPAGRPSWLLDQLPFVLAALAAAWLMGASFAFSPIPLIFLLVLTIVLHRGANAFAHASGLKKVPW